VSVSSFSEAWRRNTPRYLTWPAKLTFSTFGEATGDAGFKLFRRTNYTDCLVTIKSSFMFISIITTNIQKALRPLKLGPNTHKSSGNSRWFTTIFPTAHPVLPILKVHQGKQQQMWTPNSPLSYHIGYGECVWKASAPLHLHGLLPTLNHQQSYYSRDFI